MNLSINSMTFGNVISATAVKNAGTKINKGATPQDIALARLAGRQMKDLRFYPTEENKKTVKNSIAIVEKLDQDGKYDGVLRVIKQIANV